VKGLAHKTPLSFREAGGFCVIRERFDSVSGNAR
jgi:hypothetical protein